MTAGRGGFGSALDAVLEMDEAERKALAQAAADTFLFPREAGEGAGG